MSLNRFFSYFGAKGHSSRYYPPPEHGTIIDAFTAAELPARLTGKAEGA